MKTIISVVFIISTSSGGSYNGSSSIDLVTVTRSTSCPYSTMKIPGSVPSRWQLLSQRQC